MAAGVEMPVEAEVFLRGFLGSEDDLARVLGEMLGNVEDGFEHGDGVALDGAALHQLIGGLGANDGDGFGDHVGEAGKELIAREAVTGVEFFVAPALIGCTTDAAEDPLRDVA